MPQPRSGTTSSQAVGITRDGRRASPLTLCREVAGDFLLSPRRAEDVIDRVRTTVHEQRGEVCDEARLTAAQRQLLRGRESCNPSLDQDLP